MMATPAQVANDLAVQADYFARRDDEIARLCRDSARLIRAMIAGQAVDGRTLSGVMTRLQGYNSRPRAAVQSQIDKSLERAMVTINELNAAPSESRNGGSRHAV
jgi:hypothetical protein